MKERFEKRIQINPKILTSIALLDEFRSTWKNTVNLTPQVLHRLQKSVVITSTGASTRIEGSTMTDNAVERFLAGLSQKTPENRDEEEVAGYADVLAHVFDNAEKLRLTESLILSFHSLLLQFSTKDILHKGAYKKKENLVIAINEMGEQIKIFEPTPAWLTKKEMDDMLYWFDQALEEKVFHPLLITANVIFEFLAIHPFTDGNGRLSRILTNMLLLQNGYAYIPYVSLEEIVEERKDAYYGALRVTQKKHKTEDENITPWVEFFLDTLVEQSRRAEGILEQKDITKLLSVNQNKIFDLFVGEKIVSVRMIHDIFPDIHEQTIKQVLRKLCALELIEMRGEGRATVYVRR